MNPTTHIRTMLQSEIAKGGDLREIVDRCANSLVGDPEFCRQFVLIHLPVVAMKAATKIAGTTPGIKRIGSKAVTSAQITALIQEDTRATWSRWIQRDEQGAEIPLMEMTKLQLMRAADRWIDHGAAAYKEAAFLRAITGRLGDSEQVRDQFTRDELIDLFENLSIETHVKPYLKSDRHQAIS